MIFVSPLRALKFAFQNFWRNLWLSLVTILILILTLYLISLVLSLNYISDNAIRLVKEKVDVDLFFQVDTTPEQVVEVQTFLKNLPQVKEVKYTSKDEALKTFREKHADDENIQSALAELDTNPLQDSVIVKAKNIEDYPKILSTLDDSSFADRIESRDYDDSREVIETITRVARSATRVGYGLSAIFIFIAVIVIFNTIRLAIYAHSQEIGIMRLVGATNWFIRAPFLLEGILYGFVASLAVLGLLYVSMTALSPYANAYFVDYDFNLLAFFHAQYLQIFLAELSIAVFLSVVSSTIAVGRYLRA